MGEQREIKRAPNGEASPGKVHRSAIIAEGGKTAPKMCRPSRSCRIHVRAILVAEMSSD